MRPDYGHKTFKDERGNYVFLLLALAADAVL